MRIKFVASVIAALSLAFVPTAAQAVATTLDVQNGGSAAVDLESGDTLDVTVAGPIAKTGAAVHELYSTWSTQSLALLVDDLAAPEDNITWPEGWTLEYTLDGTTWIDWAVTEPTDVLDIIALRSQGDVNTVGENMFKTTSTGALRAASFAGSGGGDGYNVAVGNDKVFNFWHHQEGVVTMECHTFTGELCETAELPVEGYSSNHGSSVYSDDASDKVYAFVIKDATSHFGALCFDYSTEPAEECGFTELETIGPDVEQQYPYQDMGSSSQAGDIIWTITGNGGELLCFNIATGVACPDNGWDTGLTGYAFDTGRVTAVGGKVFFTLADKLGCYDPATDGRCGGNPDVTLTDVDNRHAPVPVEGADGTLNGVCDIFTEQCIAVDGQGLNIAPSLQSFWDAYPTNNVIGPQNAQQFAYANHRLYYETTVGEVADWSTQISCYNFLTEAACVGFDGDIEGLTTFYTATIDPTLPDCVWLNQDSGVIIPIDATSGSIGCDLGNPIVELPYDAVTPRMSCVEDGRITAWENIVVNVPAGVTMSEVRVSFYDSIDPDDEEDTSTPVADYVDLTPNANGFIDLSGLTSDETGTQPSIRIDAGDVSDELAEQITATVTFVAEDPELCFALDADNYCETTVVDSPAPGSIADGIVEGTSITRPNVGNDVGSAEASTLPGLNAADMCQASALEIDLPISQLASTGVDAGTIAMGGFAVLAVGGAAVAVTRRRKA